jgi:hypothetical protein
MPMAMTATDRAIVVSVGVLATLFGARSTSPKSLTTDSSELVIAGVRMADSSTDGARQGCRVGYRVELRSRGPHGLFLEVEREPLSGCAGVRVEREERSFSVEQIQTNRDNDKRYVATDVRLPEASATLVDHRNRSRADEQEPAWTLIVDSAPTPSEKARPSVHARAIEAVDHRNDATSGERVVFVDVWFKQATHREQVPTRLFPLHVMTEKTLSLPDRRHGYRVAIASELPVVHVLSQLRPVEEIETIGAASEARFDD